MGNNYKLTVFAEIPDDIIEFVDVGVIQRSINFVEDTERCWLEQVHAEQQRGRSQGFFSPRKLIDRERPLSFWLRYNFYL